MRHINRDESLITGPARRPVNSATFLPHLAEIVNLPVEDDHEAAVGRQHRLVPFGGQIDD